MRQSIEEFTAYCNANVVSRGDECDKHSQLVSRVYENPHLIGIDPERRWKEVQLPGGKHNQASDLIFLDHDMEFVVVECKAKKRKGKGAHKQLRKAHKLIRKEFGISPRLISVKYAKDEGRYLVSEVSPRGDYSNVFDRRTSYLPRRVAV